MIGTREQAGSLANVKNPAIPPARAWRERLGLSRTQAASLLARTDRQMQIYDQDPDPQRMVRLAMAALEFLPSWRLVELGITPDWRTKRHDGA